MRALTDFGDAAVLLPLSAVMLVWFLWHGGRSVGELWLIAMSLCVAATALLKVYLYACPPAPDFVSPSGHTSLSVLIYGAIALVIASEQIGWLRTATLIAGAGWILAIAGSRLWLNAHSAPEIGMGFVIGISSLIIFARHYRRSRAKGTRLRPVIVSVIVVVAILHGHELRAEAYLQAISRHLHLTTVACIR